MESGRSDSLYNMAAIDMSEIPEEVQGLSCLVAALSLALVSAH